MIASRTLIAAVLLVAAVPLAFAQSKMYRWVGPDGKTHYSDDLPPEALTQARQEMSKSSGITLKQVDRALTPEERAAAKAKAEADAKAAEAMEKAKLNDQVLLSSYPNEAELKRAYDDRIAQIAENLKSIRFGIDSQQKSMAELLTAASNAELTSKPINPTLASQIKTTRSHIIEQQQSEALQEAQKASLHQEAAKTIAHYRDLKAAAPGPGSSPAPATAAPPAAASGATPPGKG